jgi:hypothetical protein
MTERVLGPTGGRRRKRLLVFVPLFALAALILVIGASAGPVSNAAEFEGDDGNLVKGTSSSATECAATPIDWNCFKPISWSTGTTPYRQADKVALGWEFKGIEDAQELTSDTAFAGGTKQDNDCATVNTGKAPNKDDLKRIYVASSVVNGKTYLALGWVRIPQNTTSASAHVAFEFNQGSTPCTGTGHDGLVQRSLLNGGDLLVVYDFEGGAESPTIKLLRWKNTGTCEQTGKSAATTGPCWVKTSDATAAGIAEAKVNVGSDALDQLAPPTAPATASVDETLHDSEFGEAIINLTDAEVFPANPTSCFTLGKVFAVSRSSGNSGLAQMKDLDGPGNISISNCAQVIIRKVTSPSGDTTTEFGFTTNVATLPATTTSPFNPKLKDGGSNTINNVVPNSNLNVTEVDPSPAYALTSINCNVAAHPSTVPAANISTNTTTRAVTFTIAADEVLDCTFTNTKQKQASAIDTAPWVYPNDKATVTAGATGSVTFKLYGATTSPAGTASANCLANGAQGLLYTQTVTPIPASGIVNTSNPGGGSPGATSVKIDVDGTTVYWRAEYSGDTNYFGRVSNCQEYITATLQANTTAGGTAP